MATAQMASMLDELMGRNRNVAPNEKVRELRWTDPDVCRYYLVTFCPHDLFTNTKMDLGACPKVHDEEMKKKYQEEPEDSYKKRQAVDDFLRFSQRMLTELQARVKKAKERLHLTQEREGALPAAASGQHKDTEEKMQLLSQRIASLVEDAEAAGTNGDVDKAQGLMKLSDQLREEREMLRRTIMPYLKEEYSMAQQKAMEVCETCGAFLIVGDAQQRIDDHLGGKLHIGYARLRDAVDLIEGERRQARENRDREAEERRRRREEEREEMKNARKEHGERSRERDRERRRSRSRERERRRSRSRDKKSRRRSRSREKSSRNRSRSPHHRSKRSRSRERRRSRERSRERRERERGSKRSRSRDRRKESEDQD